MNSRPLKPLQKIDNQYIECTFADTYEKIAVSDGSNLSGIDSVPCRRGLVQPRRCT